MKTRSSKGKATAAIIAESTPTKKSPRKKRTRKEPPAAPFHAAASGVDATKLLDEDLLGEIAQFLGKDSYRSFAGVSPRFRKAYQEAFAACTTTSATEMVSTVAGAELFCREASTGSQFYLNTEGIVHIPEYRPARRPLEFVRDTAARHGRLEVLQWAVAQGCPLNDYRTSAFAAYSGSLEVLQWLRENGCPWNVAFCAAAARRGHLTVLQWARANGCRWDCWDCSTCFEAARGGHLAVLQWARANGCPWNSSTCSQAARGGHLTVLQWARANGCPWDEWTCYYAALNRRSAVLEWARANGAPEF